MLGRIKTGFVVVLASAFAVAPVILNQCAASCQAHHDTVASTPSCHHVSTSASGPHLRQAPEACGHDHTGLVSADNALNVGTRVVAAGLAIVPVSASGAPILQVSSAQPHAPPDLDGSLPARSSVLRL